MYESELIRQLSQICSECGQPGGDPCQECLAVEDVRDRVAKMDLADRPAWRQPRRQNMEISTWLMERFGVVPF